MADRNLGDVHGTTVRAEIRDFGHEFSHRNRIRPVKVPKAVAAIIQYILLIKNFLRHIWGDTQEKMAVSKGIAGAVSDGLYTAVYNEALWFRAFGKWNSIQF